MKYNETFITIDSIETKWLHFLDSKGIRTKPRWFEDLDFVKPEFVPLAKGFYKRLSNNEKMIIKAEHQDMQRFFTKYMSHKDTSFMAVYYKYHNQIK